MSTCVRRRISAAMVAGLLTGANCIAVPPAVAVDGGGVWAVGQGGQGQLGSGVRANRLTLGQVSGPLNVDEIDGGRDHAIALDDAGAVWTWGNGDFGALGRGDFRDGLKAAKVPGVSGAVQVETGHYHSMARLSGGSLLVWGRNHLGQLGDGTTTDRSSPIRLGLSGVRRISAGRDYSLALMTGGTVQAWGGGANGELGDGTTPVSRPRPGQVSGLSGVTAIAGGRNHALALMGNGTVRAWGLNSSGQLGDGTRTNRSLPVTVKGPGNVTLSNVVHISAGASHSVAVLADGRVFTWGEGGLGQLGSGGSADRLTAAQVAGTLPAIASADCGRDHTMLVTRAGGLWTFGAGDYGQLVDGQTANRRTPFRVPGVDNAVDAGGGNAYTVVLRAPGA